MTSKLRSAMSPQVVVAIIALVSATITAAISNWDKLFGTVVEAKYNGYRPTGNFETELRYYLEVSGARQTLESMQTQMLERIRVDFISKHPGDAAQLNSLLAAAEKDAPKFDDVIREYVPLYQKHFTLQEIQELNKFYSTEIMQGMVKKLPLLAQDAAPIQLKMMNDYLERLERDLKSLSK